MTTIFALATPPGRSGVAVLRISGDHASNVWPALGIHTPPKPRHATLITLKHPKTDDTIDHALALWFPAPASFTGEDIIEFHLHGSYAIIRELSEILITLPDLRPAEPGEFSKRAFINGKMDLTAAEGLADLIDAETTAQKRQALRQMQGELGKLYNTWRTTIIHTLAHLEAYIDFPDEDIPPETTTQIQHDLTELLTGITTHLNDNHCGERIREGIDIAILGPPNAGKSSLLNTLAKRDAAIVSHTAGTTRDIIEVRLELAGLPVTLADTAGIREHADDIEREGIRRTHARAESADFKLILFDAQTWPDLDPTTLALIDDRSIAMLNKVDLLESPPPIPNAQCPAPIQTSTKTGEGIPKLLETLTDRLSTYNTESNTPVITRTRHRQALKTCKHHLETYLRNSDLPIELRCEELRLAAREIAHITGRIAVDDILDVVFSSFCIGK